MSRRVARSLLPRLLSARPRPRPRHSSSSTAASSAALPHGGAEVSSALGADVSGAAASGGGGARPDPSSGFWKDPFVKRMVCYTIGGAFAVVSAPYVKLHLLEVLRGLRRPKEEDPKEEVLGSNDHIHSDTENTGENTSETGEAAGNAGVSANMILKIPTVSGSHIEIAIKADLPINQLEALAESVKSGKYTAIDDDFRAALSQAAIDRINFLKNKENGALLKKDKDQIQLEQIAVDKLKELIELLIKSPPETESKIPGVIEELLNNGLKKLVTTIASSIFSAIWVYGKSQMGNLKITICFYTFDHPFSGEHEFFPDWQIDVPFNHSAETPESIDDNTECSQLQIREEDLRLVYKWVIEEYRKMNPHDAQEEAEEKKELPFLYEWMLEESRKMKGLKAHPVHEKDEICSPTKG